MILTSNEMEELRKALADIEYGKVEIQVHAGEIISVASTKVTKKKSLTNKAECAVNGHRK
jgi:hypothetical protein